MLTKFNRRTVATDSGEIIPHATVSFYWQTSGMPATVYADPEGESPLGSSVQSDPQGRLGVFLLPGYYRIVVTLGGEILDELTYEPIVNELAVSGSTDVAVHMAEMEVPSVTSYLRTLPSGFSEWRTPVEVKADLSLDQVNNTSDAQKPISIAVAAALAGKISSTEKGAAGGVATLTSASLIPAWQLPSYVDDVLEYTSYAALPTTGETGKIYITTGNNKQYRWSGTAYVELVSSPGSTDAVPEGSTNKYFTEARVRGTVLTGFTVGSNAALASTDTILAALGKVQGQLNGKATSAQGAKADTALQPGANVSVLTNDVGLINQEAGDNRYTRRSQNLADLENAGTARVNLGLGTGATADAATSTSDATVNRLMRNGAGGLMGFALTAIPANDLDLITVSALYYAGGLTLHKPPGAVGNGHVIHQTVAAGTASQMYFDAGADKVFFRRQTSSVWSVWFEYLHSGNDSNIAKKDTAQTFTDSITIDNTNYKFLRVKRGSSYGELGVDNSISRMAFISSNGTGAQNRAFGVRANHSAPEFNDGTNWQNVWHAGNLSTTIVGYLANLTSDVQAQLDAKAPATVEQNTRNASYTLALTDNNKHLYHSNSSAYTWTIPPNSSVAFPIGATVTFVNDGSGNVTIAQGSGVTIVLAGAGTTGNRTLAQYGMVTALKVGTDRWFLNGTGVS